MTTTKTQTQAKVQPRAYGKIVLTLENCILKDLDKPTPSEADGLDRETETDLRILGCELIQTAGILLKLPQVAMATGQVLFQRFFYSKSFVRHSMEATAMSCICLASKIEEAPRRVRDVINVFHHIKQVRASKPLTPVVLDQNYINLKSQVIKAERRVLKELGFCVHVKHPHKLIVMYLKYLEFEEHQQMMQMAWNYMNDSFRTDVFIRYQPEKIACACIYLTARKLGIPLPNNPPWYGVFKTSETEIIDICYRILALYKRSKPQIEKLEQAVEHLKDAYQEQRKRDKPGQNTPPAVVMVDRTNGSHNAWGGFISRALPVTVTGSENEKEKSPNKKQSSKSRSRSRSKNSRTPSRSPPDDKYHHRKRSRNRSRSRSRSRTPVKKNKKRNYSRSSSPSPIRSKHKKSDKKYDKRSRTPDRDRYINGSDKRDRSRDRYDYDSYNRDSRYDKNYSKSSSSSYKEYKEHRNRNKDSHNNGKDKYRSDHHSSKYRERSRDRRR